MRHPTTAAKPNRRFRWRYIHSLVRNRVAGCLGVVIFSGGAFTGCASGKTTGATSEIQLLASPQTLTFNARVNDPLPNPLHVSLSAKSEGSQLRLVVGSITYGAGEPGGWLGSATLNTTTLPASLSLQPGTTELESGSYHALVPVTITGAASGSPKTIAVTYIVSAVPPLQPPSLIAPIGSGPGITTTPTFRWNEASWANRYWLLVATSASALPDDLAATSCPGCVVAGFTSDTMHVLATGFSGGGTVAPLNSGTTYYWKVLGFDGSATPNPLVRRYSATGNFTTAPTPIISLSGNAISFIGISGSGSPSAQTVEIGNSGSGSLAELSSSVSYPIGSASGWLTTAINSSSLPAILTMTPTMGSLTPGNYNATVAIASGATGVVNSPQTVTVTLNILAAAQFAQQGLKLSAPGAGVQAMQGYAVAISGDGNTALVGEGNAVDGGARIWRRSGGNWAVEGGRLVGTGGTIEQGRALALAADGKTAIVTDSGGAWVWVWDNVVWTQQGPRLTGPGGAVALSADGNTAIARVTTGGLPTSASIWTRNGGLWTEKANLMGGGAVGAAQQGHAVAISGDGNTALVAGHTDNGSAGAVWIWSRSGDTWTQQGPKLVGTGAVLNGQQGLSVALSNDGNTAVVGRRSTGNLVGAVWVWTRAGSVWTQQGPALVGVGGNGQGRSVSLSSDGNMLLVGGNDATWIWRRSGGTWIQEGLQLVGTGGQGPDNTNQGWSVALSADATTAIVGGWGDNAGVGASWIFSSAGSAASPNHFDRRLGAMGPRLKR